MKAASIPFTHSSALPVFQTKEQTKAFHNKISRAYDLLSERSEVPMRKVGQDLPKVRAGEKVLAECKRVLRPGGRIVVVGIFEWTHKHFANLPDCRPIYVREALGKAGFKIREAVKKHMWIPVEIILGVKP